MLLLTLKLLCRRVSSKSKIKHFLPSCSGDNSGNNGAGLPSYRHIRMRHLSITTQPRCIRFYSPAQSESQSPPERSTYPPHPSPNPPHPHLPNTYPHPPALDPAPAPPSRPLHQDQIPYPKRDCHPPERYRRRKRCKFGRRRMVGVGRGGERVERNGSRCGGRRGGRNRGVELLRR